MGDNERFNAIVAALRSEANAIDKDEHAIGQDGHELLTTRSELLVWLDRVALDRATVRAVEVGRGRRP